MKTKLFISVLIYSFILLSCKQEYKACNCSSKNEQIKVYSEVLNELIEHHLYNSYLGKEADTIFRLKMAKTDTDKINKKLIALQNKLYDNPDRFCTIYLDTILVPEINSWNYLKINSKAFSIELKKLISTISFNGQDVIDSLNTMQNKYAAEDLRLCTSKIKSIKDAVIKETDCVIGKITLSKLFFNKEHTKGLLLYQFSCGGLCGKSEIVLFGSRNGKWFIEKTYLIHIH